MNFPDNYFFPCKVKLDNIVISGFTCKLGGTCTSGRVFVTISVRHVFK